MEKKQKGFGSYFGKCFGIMLLIAFLVFIIFPIIKIFFNATGNDMSNSNVISTIQFYVPMIIIIASVPVSLIYAAIKSGK